jgi:hypothetical protein
MLMYQLPAAESEVGELISELLHKGFGLAESVALDVGSWEDEAL